MKQSKLIWHIFPAVLLVGIAVLLAVIFYAARNFNKFYYQQIANDLEIRARLIEPQIRPQLISGDYISIDKLCKSSGKISNTRITIIMPDGLVVGDTDESPATIKGHSDRPEFMAALNSGLGTDIRYSKTVNKNMMYLALPIRHNDQTLAVVRTSIPVTLIEQQVSDLYQSIVSSGIIITLCTAGVSLLIARRISSPIAQMKEMAQKYAAGNLNEPLTTTGATELVELAKALNKMAQQLSERITTIIEDKKQIQAILSSMIEGVLAVNGAGNIVSINSAAAKALGIDESSALGHNFEEVVRNQEIQKFIRSIFEGNRPSETDINTASSGQRILQLHGTNLTDSKGGKNGAVVVLHDITRLRRLEDVRRDFVANVSHELKTPITSIKGFIETLQDGAADNPEETARFLEIIARHADRLNAIVDDLLSLSRLEEDSESRRVFFEMAYIKPIISSAVELAATKAQKKNISIIMECDENITAKVNSVLIEQAIFNFIDNAIKYSNPETKIQVKAMLQNDKLDISVSDTGNGIEEQHLPRLFERFYVVDKSRSRKLGGTGLGLSIVKHIALVHGGEVSVVSQPGQGSTFSLCLPAHLHNQK